MAHQRLMLNFPLVGNIREMSHICGRPDRTDHLHNVGCLCAGSVLRDSGAIRLGLLLCTVSLGEQGYSNAEEAKHRSS